MTKTQIDYIELPATNFDAVQTFYEQVFGWEFTDYGGEYKAFEDGRLSGGFYLSDKYSTTQNGAVLVVLFTHDLESKRDQIIAAGGKIVQDIFAFPGGRRFQFTDPHGNELAVWAAD